MNLDARRVIARNVLEGRHGFQFRWDSWTQAHDALESLSKSTAGAIVMVRGPVGAGITSLLGAFVAAHSTKVIAVRHDIFLSRVNLVDRVQQRVFPSCEFGWLKRVPKSLVEFVKLTGRRTIVVDDADIISHDKNSAEVIIDDMLKFALTDAEMLVIFSTRRVPLQNLFCKIKSVQTADISLSGSLTAQNWVDLKDQFCHWADSRYGLNIREHAEDLFATAIGSLEIAQAMSTLEVLYCAALLCDQMPATKLETLETEDLKWEVQRVAYG
ncbi:hypothetical protein QF019_003154 [Pseudomonas frederiksbergensis]|uniref:hypothetical protein n=1 Tax=Pseudomonas frederiksbergensis TaxID=104087 RepID=UPI003D1BB072